MSLIATSRLTGPVCFRQPHGTHAAFAKTVQQSIRTDRSGFIAKNSRSGGTPQATQRSDLPEVLPRLSDCEVTFQLCTRVYFPVSFRFGERAQQVAQLANGVGYLFFHDPAEAEDEPLTGLSKVHARERPQ